MGLLLRKSCRKNSILYSIALVLASSCSTTNHRDARVSNSSALVGDKGSPATAHESESGYSEIEPDGVSDSMEVSDLEDIEFCKDNIYAQYLKDQYLKENRKALNPEKAFKPTQRGRRRGVATKSPYDAREVEALFYARSRLIGESVPYFGAIPVVTNPRVEHWVRYFKNNGRRSFLRWLVRGQSVRNVVLPILKDQGLPAEFIFLSMVESGFSNSAYSSAKATGPWQFMPGTAKLYGLKVSPWIDERRDPGKSTRAAANLLRDLYQEFGDWYLAMAAYNAGSGRVRTAIRRTNSKSFWDLANSPYLPVETKNYVPKVLAALMLASNPEAHGFEVVADPRDVIPVTQIALSKPVAIQEISEKLGVSEKQIRIWNPELVNAITPPSRNGGEYMLTVGPSLVEKWPEVSQNLTYLDVKDVLVHKVRKGDTISSIAARYKVGVKAILNVNPKLSTGRLKIGGEVSVPVASMSPARRAEQTTTPRRPRQRG